MNHKRHNESDADDQRTGFPGDALKSAMFHALVLACIVVVRFHMLF